MRKLILLITLVALTVGCKNTIGPRQSRQLPPPTDPLLSIEEQKRRARFQYSLPQDDVQAQPRGFIDEYGPTGR